MKKKKGFTLVELLVVIAILAILAAVSVVGYLGFTEKANKSVDEQLCTQYNTILDGYSIEDKDISLSDLLYYLEEEGLNHNQFATSSKSYEFAYDASNYTCVLVDSTTKEVKFPANHTISIEGLWQVYPTDQRLNRKIKNYTLLASYPVFYPTNYSGELNIDLRNELVVISKELENKTTFNNGTVILDGVAVTNVVEGTECTIKNTSDGDYGHIFDGSSNDKPLEFDENNFDETTGIYTIDSKFFGTSGDLDGKSTEVKIDLNTKTNEEIKKVVFKNIIFNNVTLRLSAIGQYHIGDIEIIDCKFYNLKDDKYAILTSNADANITIKDCEFVNCKNGINLTPIEVENSKGGYTIVIENNIFDMLVSKDTELRKNEFIIQMAATANYKVSQIAENYAIGDIIIRNNEVKNASVFINFHHKYAGASEKEVYTDNRYDKIVNKMTITGNIIAGGITKVQGDPKTKEELGQQGLEAMNDFVSKILNKMN